MSKKKIEQAKKQHVIEKGNHHILVAIGLFVFSCLIYANTLNHGFVLDDPLAIELNKNVTSGLSGIDEIIAGGYRENNFGGQLYRPVSLIQFAIEWSISPNNPFIHHLFNIGWYATCVVLMFLVLKQWFKKQNLILPIFSALLFAAHPLHTEVVANVKSRDEIMAVFFILLAMYVWNKYLSNNLKRYKYFSVGIFSLALVSKESAVTMFPVFGMIIWYFNNEKFKKAVSEGLIFLVPVAALFIIRFLIFGSVPPPQVDIMDNPIVAASGLGARLATSLLILFQYIKLIVFPYPLSSDYSFTVIAVSGFNNPKVWFSLLLYSGLTFYAFRNIKQRSFLSFCIMLYLLSVALYSQILITIGTMFGERLAFLPSLWFIFAFVYYILNVLKVDLVSNIKKVGDIKQIFLIGFAIITVIFSGLTITRNQAWSDNYTLFTTDVKTYPTSVRLNNGAAETALQLANQPGIEEIEVNRLIIESEKYCNQIMDIRPVSTAFLTLGNIRMKQKKYKEALTYYDQVNDLKNIVDTNKALAYRELARQAGEKENNIQKSLELLSLSLQLNDKDAESWSLMGVCYGVSGDHQKAGEYFEKAFALQPKDEYAKNVISAYKNLGNEEKINEYQTYIK